MKKNILGLLFAVFAVAVMGYHGMLGQVRQGPTLNNEMTIHYNAINYGSRDLDDSSVTLWIPDLNYYWRTSSFDLDDGNKDGGFIIAPRDDLPAGEYLARVMLYNSHSSDSKWMWISVE